MHRRIERFTSRISLVGDLCFGVADCVVFGNLRNAIALGQLSCCWLRPAKVLAECSLNGLLVAADVCEIRVEVADRVAD